MPILTVATTVLQEKVIKDIEEKKQELAEKEKELIALEKYAESIGISLEVLYNTFNNDNEDWLNTEVNIINTEVLPDRTIH